MLWEHESPLHWVLVITRTRHQEQLEHSERLRLYPLVEDRHVLQVPLKANAEVRV